MADNAGGNECWWLVTSAEFFQNSGLFTALIDANLTGTIGADMAKATYGGLWSMWAFMADDGTQTALGAAEADQIIFIGERIGKGIAFRWGLDTAGALLKTTSTVITSKFTASNVTNSNTAVISAPTGGMGQFKGLTQGTQ